MILTQLESEQRAVIEKKKQINRSNNESNKSPIQDYKSPWDKIIQNIAIKESDYKGSKDVARFRQALLNKKSDLDYNY